MDTNVQKIIQKYQTRMKKGFEKYGTDTTRKDLETYEWLNHLQEELMDATVYIERLKSDLDEVIGKGLSQAFAPRQGQLELNFKGESRAISEYVNGDRFASVNEVPGGYELICEQDGRVVQTQMGYNLQAMEYKAEDFVMEAK